eukprot:3552661-Pleurochrysis_carterae.AAC.1
MQGHNGFNSRFSHLVLVGERSETKTTQARGRMNRPVDASDTKKPTTTAMACLSVGWLDAARAVAKKVSARRGSLKRSSRRGTVEERSLGVMLEYARLLADAGLFDRRDLGDGKVGEWRDLLQGKLSVVFRFKQTESQLLFDSQEFLKRVMGRQESERVLPSYQHFPCASDPSPFVAVRGVKKKIMGTESEQMAVDHMQHVEQQSSCDVHDNTNHMPEVAIESNGEVHAGHAHTIKRTADVQGHHEDGAAAKRARGVDWDAAENAHATGAKTCEMASPSVSTMEVMRGAGGENDASLAVHARKEQGQQDKNGQLLGELNKHHGKKQAGMQGFTREVDDAGDACSGESQ